MKKRELPTTASGSIYEISETIFGYFDDLTGIDVIIMLNFFNTIPVEKAQEVTADVLEEYGAGNSSFDGYVDALSEAFRLNGIKADIYVKGGEAK